MTINSEEESAALDAVNCAIAIGLIVSSAVNGNSVIAIKVINPNLFTLAAQYLGDATQWQKIAALNGIFDPQPIGSFNLLIPNPQS